MTDKPTVAQDAIAQADAYLNNAVLPTYSELLAALRGIEFACTGVDYMETEYVAEVSAARALLARHERTMAGDFGG